MSSALDESNAGLPGPGDPRRKPVPLIFMLKGHGSRFAYRLMRASDGESSGHSHATRRSTGSSARRRSGTAVSSEVLSRQLARWPEHAPPTERPARQRCGEVLAAAIRKPRRGGRLVADQALVGLRLEQMGEAPPGDDQG